MVEDKEHMSVLSTWQQRVFLASQYMMEDLASESLYPPFDNTSHRCPSSLLECGTCPDEPAWLLFLRSVKITLIKLARAYHVMPVLLMIVPCALGILIGIFIGRRWEQKLPSTHVRPPPVSYLRALLGLYPAPPRRGEVSTTVQLSNTPQSQLQGSRECRTTPETTSNLEPSATPAECEELGGEEDQDTTELHEREERVRRDLRSSDGTGRLSRVDSDSSVPKHVAVIMDGNRRYGRAKYGKASRGHWEGSRKLVEFAKWCIAEGVEVLTVYAFSTENWNRDPSEVASLMALFHKYCDELREEATLRNIRIRVLSTDSQRIPAHVQTGLDRMVEDTKRCTGLALNICLSYGSRGEIVNACQSLAHETANGQLRPDEIGEEDVRRCLLTSHCGDPDVLIRTSGEIRVSNFMLWQLAYSEMFFVPKTWPELSRADLVGVIEAYANGRRRRYGK